MQPVAVDTNLISKLIEDFWDIEKLSAFSDLGKNLKRFHKVYIDKNSRDHSRWLQEFRNIRDKIQDQNIRKLFDDTYGPRRIRYIANKLDFESELFHKLVEITPDKIGVSSKKEKIKEGIVYDIESFNSTENFKPNNYLFRIPKTIHIAPDYLFKSFKLFEPYLRAAVKLEFCDKFLFKGRKFDDDKFIIELLKIPQKLSKVIFHLDINQENLTQLIRQQEVKEKIEKNFNLEPEFEPFNYDKEHTRFILVDHNKYTITLDASFNNFKINRDGKFETKKAFNINFADGRLYNDR